MHLTTLTKYEFLTKARENFVNRKDEEEEQILGDQWGSYNTNAGVWEKVPLLDSCYFYSQVWRLLSAFLHTSIPFCNIVYTLNILHTDILTMQNQASSNIFHMHLAKQPSLQPGSSWRSANILTRYKEAHTRNSFSPAPEENWNENYVIMDWLKEACQP